MRRCVRWSDVTRKRAGSLVPRSALRAEVGLVAGGWRMATTLYLCALTPCCGGAAGREGVSLSLRSPP